MKRSSVSKIKAPFLSVVIPGYNEEKNLRSGILDQVYSYLVKQTYTFELILSDDGSTDHTLEIFRAFSEKRPEVEVIANPHQGKGPTVASGMMVARGQNRLYSDLDQSTPIKEIEKLLPFRSKNNDVVIGSREVAGSTRDEEPWFRHIMGKGFNLVVRIFTVRGIHDTQCGFKLFSAKATKKLFPKLTVTTSPKRDSFTGAFDVELLYLARIYNFSIAEVPVLWKHIHTERVSPIKDSIRMFLEVVRIRLAAMLGRYD